MRKITEITARALHRGESIKMGNTVVENGNIMQLHGNTIAVVNHADHVITLRDCGWTSTTTKERLNGILSEFNTGKYIVQENFQWFVKDRANDKIKDLWDGFIVVGFKA